LEYLHAIHVIGFEIPRWIGIGIVLVLFVLSTIYAMVKGRAAEKELAASEKAAAAAEAALTGSRPREKR
jgi:type VI protein secretion system component VasK